MDPVANPSGTCAIGGLAEGLASASGLFNILPNIQFFDHDKPSTLFFN